nr:unnamed protein product [Digitaria exilis]
MRPFVPSLLILPTPTPSLVVLPPHFHRRRLCLPAPLAASASSRRPYYRRRRDAPRQPPLRSPTPSLHQHQQQPRPQQQRPANAAAPGGRSQEELEEAIFEFMRRSDKPGAFPTREELLAAGRADLAAAVASSGGWLSLGWSSAGSEGPTRRSSGGGHPDYPPSTGVYRHDGLAPGSEGDSRWEEAEEEVSPSGRQPDMEETKEVTLKAGIEGMLTRLQKDRERARPPPRRSDNGALAGNSGIPSHTVAGDRHNRRAPDNGSVHGSYPQNGTLYSNNTLQNSSKDAWQTWNLGKSDLSNFEAAEVLPTETRKLSRHDRQDIALAQNDFLKSSNGVAVSEYPSDDVDSERDEIHSRLQNLELDLSAALKTLRSRFDRVLSNMSNDKAAVLDDISDDWEFEETKRKLERSESGMFSLNLRLYPGRYEIKFIVDGVWKNDPLRPTVYNNGHENNLLVVT